VVAKHTSGFIYAIGTEWNAPVKIGVAVNIARRLESLQSGNHVTLSLLWQSGLLDDPFAVEAQLHNAFRPHLVRGEWFHVPGLSSDVLSAAVEGAHTAIRMFPTPDEPSKAASDACAFLLKRLCREGLSNEDAIGSLANSSGLGRSTIWALRYRPPTQITMGPYIAITAELWRVTGNTAFGSDPPAADDVMAVLRGEAPRPRRTMRDLSKLTELTEKLREEFLEAMARKGAVK
jgi:hypothetical protein